MSSIIWITIGIIIIIVWGVIIWKIYTSPVMPDDYSFEDDDIDIEKQQQLKKKKWKTSVKVQVT